MSLLVDLMEGGQAGTEAAWRMAGVKGKGWCEVVGNSTMPRSAVRRY